MNICKKNTGSPGQRLLKKMTMARKRVSHGKYHEEGMDERKCRQQMQGCNPMAVYGRREQNTEEEKTLSNIKEEDEGEKSSGKESKDGGPQ